MPRRARLAGRRGRRDHLARPGTPPGRRRETVDLAGALVAPAFVDAHVHATSAGLLRTGLDLTGGELAGRRARRRPRPGPRRAGRAAWGHGWDETRWPDQRPAGPRRAGRRGRGHAGVPVPDRRALRAGVHRAGRPRAAGPRRPPAGRPTARSPATRTTTSAAPPASRSRPSSGARRSWRSCATPPRVGIACVHECGGPDISGEDDFRELLALRGDAAAGGRLLGRVRRRGRRAPAAWPATCSSTARSAPAPRRCASPTRTRRTPAAPATSTRSGSPNTWWRAPRPACRPAST